MNEKKIVSNIIEAYNDKSGIFQQVPNLLENQLPSSVKYKSKEHASFYFYLIYNDHGTKSINLYGRFKNLYDTNPELFNPEYIVKNYLGNEDKFYDDYLYNMGLRYPKQSAKSWIVNSELLCDKYDGNILGLYQNTTDALELFKQIKDCRSYGMKTTGLLLRVIKGVGFNTNLNNFENVPLPVDTHDSKIALFCNLYKDADIQTVYQTKHIKQISSIWQNISDDLNIDWEELDRALWLLGSAGCAKKMCYICPILEFCDKGKGIEKSLFNHSTI